MTGAWALGVYVLVVGFLLIQNVYGVWPPLGQAGSSLCDEVVGASATIAAESEQTTVDATNEGANPDSPPEDIVIGVNQRGAPSPERIAALRRLAVDSTFMNRMCAAKILAFAQVATVHDVTSGVRILLIVILMGALGSWIHIASSYAKFVGNRTLVSSWLPWYVVRPLIGSALAVVFYIVMRAGFVSDVSGPGNALYSMAAAAGMVGLFTAIATEKLRDVFVALFAPRSADRDSLEGHPKPRIAGIEPPDVFMDEDQTVVLKGAGFISESKVLVGGREHEFTLKGETQIELTLSVDELSTGPEISICVRNPQPGGGDSEPAKLIVKR
jgi:hypothetical protein